MRNGNVAIPDWVCVNMVGPFNTPQNPSCFFELLDNFCAIYHV